MNVIRYLGGKFRLKKKISDIINKNIGNLDFYAPCCGSCWVEAEVKAKNIFLSDYHFYLIEMWKAFQNGYEPIMPITEEVYQYVKANLDEDPALSGFVGFGCSFGGKWWGGYARGDDNRKHDTAAYKAIKKKIANLQHAEFSYKNLYDVNPVNALIYIDPPYEGTTQYKGVEKFDHIKFWNHARELSKNNLVLISEFNAPDDFVAIKEFAKTTDLRNSEQQQKQVVDKLFVHESQLDKWKI